MVVVHDQRRMQTFCDLNMTSRVRINIRTVATRVASRQMPCKALHGVNGHNQGLRNHSLFCKLALHDDGVMLARLSWCLSYVR